MITVFLEAGRLRGETMLGVGGEGSCVCRFLHMGIGDPGPTTCCSAGVPSPILSKCKLYNLPRGLWAPAGAHPLLETGC